MISKKKVITLSKEVEQIIDGKELDLRDNQEGAWSELRNQIHTLASLKNEQVKILEQERRFMQEILADISHQLKTPLTSMLITADLMENASEEKRVDFLNRMRTDLTHTEWLVAALLKQAKLDAGVVPFRIERHSVDTLIQSAITPVEILIEMRQQKVLIQCDEDYGQNQVSKNVSGYDGVLESKLTGRTSRRDLPDETYLTCDSQWTIEALTNVIKNASEHSPNQGDIYIRYGTNPICTWISITDSGMGISQEAIPNLFRRFKGSRSDKGYGVGLPMALSIMRNQNGDMEVEGGGDGKGATFTLKFYHLSV